MRRQRTTLSDVAKQAGVSSITVSRALRQPAMVSPGLRQRIERAVQELAYIPNRYASGLASARSHTIGVVVPSLTNGVFGAYLQALHDTFMAAGIQVLVLNSNYIAGEEETAIATLLGQHPEAMIVVGIDQTARARKLLVQSQIPVVQTMELADDPIDINIGISQRDAGYAATRFLLGLGHRRVGHIAAGLDLRWQRRMKGYEAAMQEAGVEPRQVMALTPQPTSVAVGGELLRELLGKSADIEAVTCCNDDLALGALFECHRRGIRVPGDMSIVGFNDLEFSASAFPALTSVATPRHEMGRLSAEVVLEIIRGAGARPREARIDLGFSIRQRESTAQRKPAADLAVGQGGIALERRKGATRRVNVRAST